MRDVVELEREREDEYKDGGGGVRDIRRTREEGE